MLQAAPEDPLSYMAAPAQTAISVCEQSSSMASDRRIPTAQFKAGGSTERPWAGQTALGSASSMHTGRPVQAGPAEESQALFVMLTLVSHPILC